MARDLTLCHRLEPTLAELVGTAADAPHSDISLCQHCGMERCHNCGQPLIEIDNHGERLTGCLTCNLWAAGDAKVWTRLSEEDLNALHQLRHGGHK